MQHTTRTPRAKSAFLAPINLEDPFNLHGGIVRRFNGGDNRGLLAVSLASDEAPDLISRT
jgi:hypothetical protein